MLLIVTGAVIFMAGVFIGAGLMMMGIKEGSEL